MISQFKHIGIVIRPQTPHIEHCLQELVCFLLARKIHVYLDGESIAPDLLDAEDAGRCHWETKASIARRCDLVVALGGDGTFLSVAREVAPFRVPLIGVNQGHLGFLTQVPRENMTGEIGGMLTGKYRAEERILLEAALLRDNASVNTALALNDVVISRGGAGQMIEFEVFIDQEFVCSQRSDGLIVATPTGSTAYSLAAGGPILQASLRAFTLVPICPQSMTNRPIAVPDTCEINILITKAGDGRVHFDGQSHTDVHTGDSIRIHRYRHSLRVLHPSDYQYYKILRQKLHWGEQLVNLSDKF
ncbi:NAD(+)/NADH kinase [Neisseria leonii]|uniref:NAD(+)/NADH kinase n=1 Tax=Neisseria leonii TaxID=2995413 RepID=UPI00237A4F77|nr:NAD(+)/NADH kinase [Neisseria sp. 3986]MDD9325470.1 NAD(+)/NADH kinase [Neisseria sp. 3986]